MHLFHRWDYTPAVYENQMMRELAIPKVEGKRVCRKCGLVQVEDTFCLGLNPPSYTTAWRTIPQEGAR